jgi:type IV pilus assembly protein PilV
MHASTDSAGGFTLVETLIALLVLAVGLLGLAHLYVECLRATHAALLRSRAVTLSADLAERIRANRDPADAYDCGGSCGTGTGGNTVAIDDLQAWVTAVAALLPDGDCAVTYTAGTAGVPHSYLVTVSWVEIGHSARLAQYARVEL